MANSKLILVIGGTGAQGIPVVKGRSLFTSAGTRTDTTTSSFE